MPAGALPRSLLVLIAVVLWLGGFLASAAAVPHSHQDAGFYNEECVLVSLATLGSSVALAERGDATGTVPIVAPADTSATGHAPDAPNPVATSRAPPLA